MRDSEIAQAVEQLGEMRRKSRQGGAGLSGGTSMGAERASADAANYRQHNSSVMFHIQRVHGDGRIVWHGPFTAEELVRKVNGLNGVQCQIIESHGPDAPIL